MYRYRYPAENERELGYGHDRNLGPIGKSTVLPISRDMCVTEKRGRRVPVVNSSSQVVGIGQMWATTTWEDTSPWVGAMDACWIVNLLPPRQLPPSQAHFLGL